MTRRRRALQQFNRDELMERAYAALSDIKQHYESGHLVCTFSNMCDTDCTGFVRVKEFMKEFEDRGVGK